MPDRLAEREVAAEGSRADATAPLLSVCFSSSASEDVGEGVGEGEVNQPNIGSRREDREMDLKEGTGAGRKCGCSVRVGLLQCVSSLAVSGLERGTGTVVAAVQCSAG